jgi:hypothetical protein
VEDRSWIANLLARRGTSTCGRGTGTDEDATVKPHPEMRGGIPRLRSAGGWGSFPLFTDQTHQTCQIFAISRFRKRCPRAQRNTLGTTLQITGKRLLTRTRSSEQSRSFRAVRHTKAICLRGKRRSPATGCGKGTTRYNLGSGAQGRGVWCTIRCRCCSHCAGLTDPLPDPSPHGGGENDPEVVPLSPRCARHGCAQRGRGWRAAPGERVPHKDAFGVNRRANFQPPWRLRLLFRTA